MMQADATKATSGDAQTPVMPQIRFDAHGSPSLVGRRCDRCGQLYLETPTACPRCFSRAPMEEATLSSRGTLYSFTVIYRSFPGVPTPFVMAIVDMTDGLTIRGTLSDIDPMPEAIPFGLPVRLEFRDSGQRDVAGLPYLAFVFVPDRESLS